MLEYFGTQFVSGAITMGLAAAGLFFLRFWVRTHDKLFLSFAVAFWLMALNQLLALAGNPRDEQSWIYLIRLAAFIVLIIAILRKNIGSGQRVLKFTPQRLRCCGDSTFGACGKNVRITAGVELSTGLLGRGDAGGPRSRWRSPN